MKEILKKTAFVIIVFVLIEIVVNFLVTKFEMSYLMVMIETIMLIQIYGLYKEKE